MKQPFSIIVLIAIIMMACNCTNKQEATAASSTEKTQETKTIKRKALPPKSSLKGQLYLFAPELNTADCSAAGSCDCCSWNILFPSDTSFVMIDYCEASYTYFKGTYTFDNTLLTLNFSNRSVEKTFNEESITTHKEPTYIYNVNTVDSSKMTFIKQHCNREPIFKGNNGYADYGVIDKKRSLKKLLRSMKEDGVWQKLQLP